MLSADREVTADEWIPALALLAVITRELLWIAGLLILLSGLDDLAMDAAWLALVAPRRRQDLPPPPEVPARFAILVPAWDEAAVIADMLRHGVATLDHPDATWFVGVYPNDPATRAAVESVRDPRIRIVTVSRPGPTSKADCLNHLWRGVLEEERASGRRFGAIVLHDAEDVVDPLELRLYERFLPRLALVQIPVLPLVDPASPFVAGHYLDEFAESHARDMMVRARLGIAVPSAGVGTAFSREALALLAGDQQAPFDATSLTEDYEIAHRLQAAGLRGEMIRHRVDGRLIATRAYFPASIEAAVRQKSRWLTGIALAGWDRLGREGPPAQRWLLMRDRKGLVAAAAAVIAYAAALLVLVQLAGRAVVGELAGVSLPPFLSADSHPLLLAVLTANAVLLGWRMAMRAAFTAHEHGMRQGALAVLRAFVGNIINALAALRAADRYRAGLLSAPIAWEKTEHRFPAYQVAAAAAAPGHG